jgi:hypothetical protein
MKLMCISHSSQTRRLRAPRCSDAPGPTSFGRNENRWARRAPIRAPVLTQVPYRPWGRPRRMKRAPLSSPGPVTWAAPFGDMGSGFLTGRPSIPETPAIESRGRGVLDRAVKPGDDGFVVAGVSPNPSFFLRHVCLLNLKSPTCFPHMCRRPGFAQCFGARVQRPNGAIDSDCCRKRDAPVDCIAPTILK